MIHNEKFPAGEWAYGLFGEEDIPSRAMSESVVVDGNQYYKIRIEFLVDGKFEKANTSVDSYMKGITPVGKEEFASVTGLSSQDL